jgi:hypothetical protein
VALAQSLKDSLFAGFAHEHIRAEQAHWPQAVIVGGANRREAPAREKLLELAAGLAVYFVNGGAGFQPPTDGVLDSRR